MMDWITTAGTAELTAALPTAAPALAAEITLELIHRDKRCPWCANPDADDVDDPETLCAAHYAEHEGLSEVGVEHRDAQQRAEYDEWVLGR